MEPITFILNYCIQILIKFSFIYPLQYEYYKINSNQLGILISFEV
jgi:hypothetical protein